MRLAVVNKSECLFHIPCIVNTFSLLSLIGEQIGQLFDYLAIFQ